MFLPRALLQQFTGESIFVAITSKLYFPTNFLMPLALGFSRIISILYAFNAAQVYLLKDPVLYVCRDGCLLWGGGCILGGLPFSGVPLCLCEFMYEFDIGRNWTSPSDRSVLWCLTEAWQQLHQVCSWLLVCLYDARSYRHNTHWSKTRSQSRSSLYAEYASCVGPPYSQTWFHFSFVSEFGQRLWKHEW